MSKETAAIENRTEDMDRTILVPIDDSEQSREAVAVAATDFNDAELIVVRILKPFVVMSVTESAVWDDEFMNRRKREAEQLLEDYRELATEYGADVRTELVRGAPIRSIISISDEFDVDHIVMGCTKKRSISRLFLRLFTNRTLGFTPVSASVTVVCPTN
ncbi:universal stress protein [Halocatena marina]|uniref:universal stress protein n=1 Tax=Halocatena marina TaxID=2934937 RepID=UPI00200EAFDD|nr:universal stress protein [Halocatena marina]